MQLGGDRTADQYVVADDFQPVGLVNTLVLLQEERPVVVAFGVVEQTETAISRQCDHQILVEPWHLGLHYSGQTGLEYILLFFGFLEGVGDHMPRLCRYV